MLTTLLSALMNAFFISQLSAQEQETKNGGANSWFWIVLTQCFFLTAAMVPLGMLMPLSVWISPLYYGLVSLAATLGYIAHLGNKNQMNAAEENNTSTLPFGLHKNSFFIKSINLLSSNFSYLSMTVYALSLGAMAFVGGFTPFLIATGVVLLADKAYQNGFLPARLGTGYIWLMSLISLTSFFGVDSLLSIALSTSFIGFSLYSYINVYVRETESNSVLYPITDPKKQMTLDSCLDESLEIKDKASLAQLYKKIINNFYTVTYNHFGKARSIAYKLITNTPVVDVEDYARLFSQIDFDNTALQTYIAVEIAQQGHYATQDLAELKSLLSLPDDAALPLVYVAYLKREMRYCVERLQSAYSRDMQQEHFISLQKQARHVLYFIKNNMHIDKETLSRCLIDIAIKTGSQCNGAYADTFGELFETFYPAQESDAHAKLSLQERTILALQIFREQCFRNFYCDALAKLKQSPPLAPFAKMFGEPNDYRSYELFSSFFGANFYLRNQLFAQQTSIPWMNKCFEQYFNFFLSKHVGAFTDFYSAEVIIEQVLTQGTHLHSLFQEWCTSKLYTNCYQDIAYDEEGYPKSNLKYDINLRCLAGMMLADFGIFDVEKRPSPLRMLMTSSPYLDTRLAPSEEYATDKAPVVLVNSSLWPNPCEYNTAEAQEGYSASLN